MVADQYKASTMFIFRRPERQLTKSEQLSLFDMPVHVAASIDKNGVVRPAHVAIRKKRVAAQASAPHASGTKLDSFIAKHGGAAHLKAELDKMTPEQRAKMLDAMAHVDGIDHAAVMAKLAPVAVAAAVAPPAQNREQVDTGPEPMSGPAADIGNVGPDIANADAAPPPAAAQPQIIEHVTGKGKTLRGIVRTDLTADQAKAIDAYTFKKNGGWFIRERHIEVADKLDAAHQAGVITPEQHAAARAGAAESGADGAAAALRLPAEPAAPAVDAGPQDGDTKTEEGIEYVLRDGRWHRAQEDVPVAAQPSEPEPEEAGHDAAHEPELPPQQSAEVELAEERQDLAEEMQRAPNSLRAQQLRQRIARAEGNLPPVDEDDPNSPNYRFRDTGEIAGSRKEKAALQIRQAAKAGERLRATDIDWDEIEQNPREAAGLITKSNLFGKVDWDALRAAGMEPGAGFLVDRVYAAIAADPDGEGAQKRRDFALGLETLRDRMERCKTATEVVGVLAEIKDEITGEMLSATESEEYRAIMERYSAARQAAKDAEAPRDALYQAWNKLQQEYNSTSYEQDRRQRRKWKPDPALDAKASEQKAAADAAHEQLTAFIEAHPELVTEQRDLSGGYVTYENELEFAARQIRMRADVIKQAAIMRNIMANPLTRAWATLGDRFLAVVDWRYHKGSEAFRKHVTAAKTGKVVDWSWAEKESTPTPKVGKQQVQFQLKVAENFDRVGGRAVHIGSTVDLKDRFNLREVQSGNWVLHDVDSAAFHVQRSAEAFSDLADILGVPDEQVSMNGRLAMSFGARGRGNAGWKGAARAHWEPVQRVINLTKMGGGGALAHEWFHGLDNMIKEAEGLGPAGVDDFASENASVVPEGEVREAFQRLRRAMTDGDKQQVQEIAYSDRDLRTARYNIDGRPSQVGSAIKAAADAGAAVQAVDAFYLQRYGSVDKMKRSVKTQYDTWRRLAAAYHDKNEAGGVARVAAGARMSSYQFEAINLDGGTHDKYWSCQHEMAARAFQSYIEDKLAAAGRKNDYLSWGADNKYHFDPIFGPRFPYPEGEERQRINAAFDELFGVLSKRGTLAKAMEIMGE